MRTPLSTFGPWIFAALVAAGAALLAPGCAEDECDLPCPSGRVCELDNTGEARCVATCGGQVCSSGQECIDNTCTTPSVECGAGEHDVRGQCIPDYTNSNVCDPLRECRRGCGTSVACLDACEADRSTRCATCEESLLSCESSENCDSGGYAEDCCFSTYCECFPSHPNCGNVPPCNECVEEADGNASEFNSCVSGEPACSSCLQPFFECREETDGTCTDDFCSCNDVDDDCR